MMFSSDFKEKSAEEVKIEEIDDATGAAIVKYIYREEMAITNENALKLLAAADMLLLSDAKNFIEEFMCKEMNFANCFERLKLAKFYNLEKLMQAALNRLSHDLGVLSIRLKDEFMALTVDDLEMILKNKHTSVRHQSIFHAIQIWAQRPKKRQSMLEKLLPFISFSSMLKEFLDHSVMTNAVVTRNVLAKQRAQTAVQLHTEPELVDYVLVIADCFGRIWRLIDGTWEEIQDLPPKYEESRVCESPGGFYITAGKDDTANKKEVYHYESETGLWRTLPPDEVCKTRPRRSLRQRLPLRRGRIRLRRQSAPLCGEV
jgi:hypothetical protein